LSSRAASRDRSRGVRSSSSPAERGARSWTSCDRTQNVELPHHGEVELASLLARGFVRLARNVAVSHAEKAEKGLDGGERESHCHDVDRGTGR